MNIYPVSLLHVPAGRLWLTLGKTIKDEGLNDSSFCINSRRIYLYNSGLTLEDGFSFCLLTSGFQLQQMKRLGFVGIIIEDREKCAGEVNNVLSDFSELIVARTGLPNVRQNKSVITLVIDATTDELGKLTGKLGSIHGVSVKSGLAKQ